jgi:hypothetical protein
MEELEKELMDLKGFATHRKNNNINQLDPPPQSSQELNHKPKSTHGGSHGSSYICSRGWHCWTSMGGETLGPGKASCPSVGECQGGEVGVGGRVGEYPHRSREREDGIGDFQRGNQERG